MSIPVPEVVLEGVYAAPGNQERVVRGIVNGKIVYEVRAEHTNDEWVPGHALDESPSIETFAAGCLRVTSKPDRYARHDAV